MNILNKPGLSNSLMPPHVYKLIGLKKSTMYIAIPTCIQCSNDWVPGSNNMSSMLLFICL